MEEKIYDRTAAVRYAREWALKRNPAYYDFSEIGGDCTNFVSQCIYAGAGVMNMSKTLGWFYINANDRTASWTSSQFLGRFLTENKGLGPYAKYVSEKEAEVGDVIQLLNMEGRPYHSLFIIETKPEILVAAHSIDSLDRRLSTYSAPEKRFLHILGVRTTKKEDFSASVPKI